MLGGVTAPLGLPGPLPGALAGGGAALGYPWCWAFGVVRVTSLLHYLFLYLLFITVANLLLLFSKPIILVHTKLSIKVV